MRDHNTEPRPLFDEEGQRKLNEQIERARVAMFARMEREERERAAFLATPEGQAAERERMEREERQRINSLAYRADQANCPSERDVRVAAFAHEVTGPVIDSVLEAVEWARGEKHEGYGRQPALRALLAERGVGKTVAMVYALTRLHRTGQYVTAAELSRTHRAMHDNRAAWASWLRADVLCVDEAGNEEKPDVVAELMLDRWSGGGITFVAGNIARQVFVKRYLSGELGLRLRDRLGAQHAAGLGWCAEFAERSRRAKPAQG